MKLRHFEKVVVISSARFPEYVGRTGVVLGISADDARVYAYGVFFPGEDEGVNFLPEELKGTGEYVDRSEFYDDDARIRVRVVGGQGSIIEE